MATFRERPYPQFNFLVNLGMSGDANSVDGGFQEVSGIGMEVAMAEYRNGNEPDNCVRKINLLNKVADITLKRGVVGSLTLYTWLNQIRNGDPAMLRNISISLLSETHAEVLVWKLRGARIIKHTTGTLNAKGSDVAMEEMVLAYERLELE